jgi:hypothetical protein
MQRDASRFECPGCQGSTTKLYTLLRPPRQPEEQRVCPACLGPAKADGWRLVHSCILPRQPLHAYRCYRCGGSDTSFHIVSLTGKPVIIERGPCCLPAAQQEGWRAACVRSIA